MKIIIMAVRESIVKQVVDLPDDEAERLLDVRTTITEEDLLRVMTEPEVVREHYFMAHTRKEE